MVLYVTWSIVIVRTIGYPTLGATFTHLHNCVLLYFMFLYKFGSYTICTYFIIYRKILKIKSSTHKPFILRFFPFSHTNPHKTTNRTISLFYSHWIGLKTSRMIWNLPANILYTKSKHNNNRISNANNIYS